MTNDREYPGRGHAQGLAVLIGFSSWRGTLGR